MSMTISKALKEKNRIAGRISKLQTQVVKYNRYKKESVREFSSKELLKSLQEEWAYLIDIKSKIAKANGGISDKLVQLTEAKAELSFWTLCNNVGPSEEIVTETKYVGGQYVNVDTIMVCDLTTKDVQTNINRVQKLIEDLQDEIDSYNQFTKI
jgi:hypothetical protein